MTCSIKLMVRDSKCLYAYWQNPEEMQSSSGDESIRNIWNLSRPCIKISNLTMSCSFIVNINDNADNWYISIEDSNCIYSAELGRYISPGLFFSICTSNLVMVPADQASNNTNSCFVNFKDIKGKEIQILSGYIYPIPSSPLPHYALDKILKLPGSFEMYRVGDPGWYGISSGEFFNTKVNDE